MVIDAPLFVDYTISVLNYIIMFPSLKIWAWLQLGHTQIMGAVVLRVPRVKIFRNHHWANVLANN